MKFAKELEREAVPEWRIKYLDYKAGKKYVKAVARAIHRTAATPRSTYRRTPTVFSVSAQSQRLSSGNRNAASDDHLAASRWQGKSEPISLGKGAEGEVLTSQADSLQYGSFVPTPAASSSRLGSRDDYGDYFELPAPAIHPQEPSEGPSTPIGALRKSLGRLGKQRSLPPAAVSNTDTLPNLSSKDAANPEAHSPLDRILSRARGPGARESNRAALTRQSFDLVREREQEFHDFMDSELDKVETFYKQKEEHSGERLVVLREQLHEMRNRRIHEMADEELHDQRPSRHVSHQNGHDKPNGWVQPIKAKIFPPGPNSKALQNMPRTPHLATGGRASDGRLDYIRRPENHEVSYRTAKRKLKLAMQEFYRSLELLKSYALLNRTAFRKLNKKFDKAANARPPLRYMNEKVNKAWFVNSDVLDGHIKAVEDLYARYFERGNQKVAAGKLRRLTTKPKDESGSSFLNGFLIGTGLVFTAQGIVYGAELLYDDNPTVRLQTSYLLQIYSGYFFMLLLFALFCINCSLWMRNKVNYPFIFEFDQRSLIDWRQLAKFPSSFLLLFGTVMWANFSRYGEDDVYLYYPVVLIGVTVIIIFLPAPVLAHKSRRWLAYSHWRLLLAGLYPVEFRDFFLGDMYCSLTYSMANVELFFCLYDHHWDRPAQCNSNYSRLLGFLAALPAIWRALQCIRRYRDTRNIFPHLVNCGKYGATIMTYVGLSLYRIHRSNSNLALYIAFSIVNGIYTSIWDLFMDFSLLQAQSRHYLLRDILALKQHWVYYAIIVVDPILRFTWIFYAIFTHDLQHSTIVSFLVSLMEVLRRGMWALLRVENEHCANVSQYKASRDVPLPYRIEPLMDHASAESSPALPSNDEEQQQRQQGEVAHSATASAVVSTLGTLRRRADTVSSKLGVRRFSTILAEAHKQDFVKKRKPAEQVAEDDREQDDDDDDDEDPSSFIEVRTLSKPGQGGNDGAG